VIGRIVTSFAYPFGDHDDQAVEIVEEAGYRAAVTCELDVVRPGANPLRLPRLAVGPRDTTDLAERLRALIDSGRDAALCS
jgi:peptidoglycan/xylan/chitin deacetylase (PgdA/CDA1 family)